MKTATANSLRSALTVELMNYFAEKGEDVGQIDSHTLNFPFAHEGEECWVQIVVKIPTKTTDEDEYEKRTVYAESVVAKAEKAKEKAEKAAKAKAERAKKEEDE